MLRYGRLLFTVAALFVFFLIPSTSSKGYAASATEIDAKVDATLKDFYKKVGAGKSLARRAKGILVFPSVIKAGFWVGGQYGEGALRVGGKNVNYYNIAGASFGFQFGAQAKSIVMLFMTSEALSGFRNSDGWEAGVDGSVALAEMGTGGSIDTNTLQQPIIGFVFGNKGLMVDVSLKGTKFTKIVK